MTLIQQTMYVVLLLTMYVAKSKINLFPSLLPANIVYTNYMFHKPKLQGKKKKDRKVIKNTNFYNINTLSRKTSLRPYF